VATSLGGSVGREHISLPGIAALSADAATSNLDVLKGNLACKLAGLSYESQMMDHLHATAYQNGPSGKPFWVFGFGASLHRMMWHRYLVE